MENELCTKTLRSKLITGLAALAYVALTGIVTLSQCRPR